MNPHEEMANAIRAEALRPLPSGNWCTSSPYALLDRVRALEISVAALQRAHRHAAELFAAELKQSRKELGLDNAA